jgi:hypothetical protein
VAMTQPLSRMTLRPSRICFSASIGCALRALMNMSIWLYASFWLVLMSYLSYFCFINSSSNRFCDSFERSCQSTFCFSRNKIVLSKLTLAIFLMSWSSVPIRSVLYYLRVSLIFRTGLWMLLFLVEAFVWSS